MLRARNGCLYALSISVAAPSVTWWRTHRTLRLSQRRDGARRSGQHCEYGQRPSSAAQRVLARSFASALVLLRLPELGWRGSLAPETRAELLGPLLGVCCVLYAVATVSPVKQTNTDTRVLTVPRRTSRAG